MPDRTAYGNSQLDYERNAVLAVSSLYGIDILENNTRRAASGFLMSSSSSTTRFPKWQLRTIAGLRNIIWGDANRSRFLNGRPSTAVC